MKLEFKNFVFLFWKLIEMFPGSKLFIPKHRSKKQYFGCLCGHLIDIRTLQLWTSFAIGWTNFPSSICFQLIFSINLPTVYIKNLCLILRVIWNSVLPSFLERLDFGVGELFLRKVSFSWIHRHFRPSLFQNFMMCVGVNFCCFCFCGASLHGVRRLAEKTHYTLNLERVYN